VAKETSFIPLGFVFSIHVYHMVGGFKVSLTHYCTLYHTVGGFKVSRVRLRVHWRRCTGGAAGESPTRYSLPPPTSPVRGTPTRVNTSLPPYSAVRCAPTTRPLAA
jgi:hypothetical protein